MSEKNLMMPGNPRYQPKTLKEIFGYDNLYRQLAEVEIAAMEALAEKGVIPEQDIALLTDEKREALKGITATQVDIRERAVTKHDIRAWVQLAQEIVGPELSRWVHVPLTSYDALDTARSLQYKRAFEAMKPLISSVIDQLREKVLSNGGTVQIGRTHGQHALPITVGFWLAGILSRLMSSASQLKKCSQDLRGKISGPVGAYNAQRAMEISGVNVGDLSAELDVPFEELVLKKLGLEKAFISSQILPPEHLADFLFAAVKMSAVLGQFGRDCRHLMRTEIGELFEPFEENQVGSSTMAHKRNPINFENLEGMWIRNKSEFGKVMDNLLSEHQRDLVGSAVSRDVPIILINLCYQLETLLREKNGKTFLERISFDHDACRRNFEQSAEFSLAEPLYIALQIAGFEDAHHLVNHRVVPLAKSNGINLFDAMQELAKSDIELVGWTQKIPQGFISVLIQPERYIGLSHEKSLQVGHAAGLFLENY